MIDGMDRSSSSPLPSVRLGISEEDQAWLREFSWTRRSAYMVDHEAEICEEVWQCRELCAWKMVWTKKNVGPIFRRYWLNGLTDMVETLAELVAHLKERGHQQVVQTGLLDEPSR
jgi:hypothetical protein